MANWAIVRSVPSSFARALSMVPPDPPIDVAGAQAEHAAYVAALAAAGFEIVRVPTDEDCPDCCFVEDTAVMIGDAVLLTRPGAPSRQAEVGPIAAALAGRAAIVHMEAPATLDGGDVLRLGRTFYVGLSTRTSRAGIDQLAAAAAPRGFRVVPVALPDGVLHLKTFCSPLADAVLLAEGTIPPDAFAGAPTLMVPAREAHATNAVVAGGTALVAAGAAAAAAVVASTGLRPVAVDNAQLRKADSALTCLSILSTG